jgi:hypothetical protein
VGGLVIVEHQVNNVGLGGDEDDLKGGVPERKGRVGPQEIWRGMLSAGNIVAWRFDIPKYRVAYTII